MTVGPCRSGIEVRLDSDAEGGFQESEYRR
jgi:hypothetical protein